ncbi:TAXI family TRAP transporter solute-binding subunit [Cytobacillus sp. NCCP-133]|uniref:TAXI family TRAP transporter solute-binding subunit n=1 Tax=Cytobacillus sp. NCCP-133 TaxID=766848 RepID=UPI002232570C|nr:TAXI family TRAP transporter solute-binding subunit [Cytobacillus sp. NCCP-133]GLB60320.1 C4-dicarboxylate ABC transporter [Cytobacillus sp. NCCP-133]
MIFLKKGKFLFLIGIVLLLILAGCQSGEQVAQKGNEKGSGGDQKSQFVRVATGGSGGNYYRLGGAMMGLMNNKFNNYEYSIQATDGTPHNIALVNSGEVEIAFGTAQTFIDAYNNEGQFAEQEKGKFQNMGFLTFVYPNVTHFGVSEWADDSFKTIYDLPGHSVSINKLGSTGTIEMQEIILPVIDAAFEDFSPEYTVHGETIDQLRNRQIDGAIWGDGIYSASWTEMMNTGFMTLKSFPDEVIEAATKDSVKFPITIEAGSYPNQDEPFTTWAEPILLVANSDMSEQAVYDFLKTTFENVEDLTAVIPLAKYIDKEFALQGQEFPLHPGAEKYFKEIGLLD